MNCWTSEFPVFTKLLAHSDLRQLVYHFDHVQAWWGPHPICRNSPWPAPKKMHQAQVTWCLRIDGTQVECAKHKKEIDVRTSLIIFSSYCRHISLYSSEIHLYLLSLPLTINVCNIKPNKVSAHKGLYMQHAVLRKSMSLFMVQHTAAACQALGT